MPEGQYITLLSNGSTRNVTDPASQAGNRIFGNLASRLDASAFIDPADCNGGAESLDFHWAITYPNNINIPDPYSCQGITGYRKAVLNNMAASSMLNQPDPFAAPGPGSRFRLTVTSRLTGLSTVVDVQAQVIQSSLTLTIFNDCKGRTTACANSQQCACTIAAALPTRRASLVPTW